MLNYVCVYTYVSKKLNKQPFFLRNCDMSATKVGLSIWYLHFICNRYIFHFKIFHDFFNNKEFVKALYYWSSIRHNETTQYVRYLNIVCNGDYSMTYSLNGRMSFHKISRSLDAARFGFELFQSPWQLTDISAATLSRCLSNLRLIRLLQHPFSRLRDFTKFAGKTICHLVHRGNLIIRYPSTRLKI